MMNRKSHKDSEKVQNSASSEHSQRTDHQSMQKIQQNDSSSQNMTLQRNFEIDDSQTQPDVKTCKMKPES